MKFGKTVAAAGLAMTLGAFAPPLFAQSSGAGGGTSANSVSSTTNGNESAGNTGQDTAGQPGTQAPASAAPLGSSSSDYMSSEGPDAAANSGPSGRMATNSEKQLRSKEVALERDIVRARANGANVSKAQHQKWLGSMALAKGDRVSAMRHFSHAEQDLTRERNNGAPSNESRGDAHANQTNQPSNAANMHSNNGTNAAY
jgi:hypothetical protein